MENQNTPQDQTSTADKKEDKKKVTKRRFARIAANDLKDLPGANLAVPKVIETGVSYYLDVVIPLSSQIGSVIEHQQASQFLFQLQAACEENAVGNVVGVEIAETKYEVTVKVQTDGEQLSHAAPLKFVFAGLNDFFTNSSFVCNHKPRWKFKVLGTTVANGILGGG